MAGWEQAGRGGKFRAGDLAAHGTGSDLYLRIVAEALDLSHLAGGHHVEMAALFGEPDWGVDGNAVFAKGGERDVALPGDRGGNRHENIVAKDDVSGS